jgi:hypothetical protein
MDGETRMTWSERGRIILRLIFFVFLCFRLIWSTVYTLHYSFNLRNQSNDVEKAWSRNRAGGLKCSSGSWVARSVERLDQHCPLAVDWLCGVKSKCYFDQLSPLTANCHWMAASAWPSEPVRWWCWPSSSCVRCSRWQLKRPPLSTPRPSRMAHKRSWLKSNHANWQPPDPKLSSQIL